MTPHELQLITSVWPSLAPYLSVPRTEREYEELTAILDSLIDNVGENEGHPLASLMDVVGVLIAQYEDEHVTEITDA